MPPDPDAKACPKCGMNQTGAIHEGYRHFDCGSFAHASGQHHQQSKPCGELASLKAKLAAVEEERDEAIAEAQRSARMFQDGFDVERVMAWQRESPPRLPSEAFTAGGERTAAYLIDDERRGWNQLLSAATARVEAAEKERDGLRELAVQVAWDAFELGANFQFFIHSSHCLDGRDLARFFGCDGHPSWSSDAGVVYQQYTTMTTPKADGICIAKRACRTAIMRALLAQPAKEGSDGK